MKSSSFVIIAITAITFIFSAGCSKVGIGGPSFNVGGAADGSQVVPASSSTAVGLITGNLDGSKNTLSATIKWSGLTGPPTAIHIHGAVAGRNGYPLFVMQNIPHGISDSIVFQSAFTEVLEASVKLNQYYFDIHTAAYPNGEIRGQILAQ